MDKLSGLLNKTLVIGIIFLFIGVAVQLSIASDTFISTTLDYNGSLLGYVNDTSGNPIEGALVRVYFHGTYEEDYSDSTGFYHVTNIQICNCTKNPTCSKEGYKTEWVLLSIVENTTHDFILTSNHPPDAPTIDGVRLVRPWKSYEWTFKAIDPDGDNVSYEIDWNDGTTMERTAWYPSGEEITRNHTYNKFNCVAIRARAMDTHGAIGDVGSMGIKISREISTPLILRFLEQFPFLEVFLRAMNLLR